MAASSSDVEVLERARRGELSRLAEDPRSLQQSVERFAAAGDASAALELVARAWRAWMVDGELQAGRVAAAAALEEVRMVPDPDDQFELDWLASGLGHPR